MRRLIALSFALVALLSLSGAPQLAQGSQLGRLQVFDIQPSPATPLVGAQAVTFTFNRRLDCASAESALRLTPEIAGAVSCMDYRLTFTPDQAWQPESAYRFELRPPLRAADGAPLLDPFVATFVAAGSLSISEVYPAAGSETVPVDSAITVVFDRPVVPLQLSAKAVALPQPLTLSPAVAGQGEWVNSAVYVYKPAAPLPGAATFRAHVTALQAADGTKLDSAYSWAFQSAPPSIVAVQPPPGSRDVILNPRIQVRFDQPLPQEGVEQAFRFHAASESDSQALSGSFEWADDGTSFAFSPANRLALDRAYRASFDAALLPNLRFADSSLTPTWTYQTVPAPAITDTEPQDGQRDDYPHGITLYFASPMDIETLDDKVSVAPAPDSAPITHYSSWNNSYTVAFDTAPDSQYEVTVAPGMQDIYGNAIAEPRLIRFSTAPRPPAVALSAYAPVAFTNARRAPHELAFYHRGVDHVDLALYKLPLRDFIARLTDPEVYDPTQDFQPPVATLLKQWRVPGNPSGKSRQQEQVALSESGLAPGIFYAELSAPGLDLRWENNKRFLNVSSAVLTLKQSADALTIWAVDASSGAPVADETIAVYGEGAEPVGSAITDARGIARLDLPAAARPFNGYAAVLDSGEHFGFGFSKWTGGADAWQFGYALDYFPEAYQFYVYTDRPVYRGDQPLYFRGLLRAKDGVNYALAAASSVTATISNPRGEAIFEEELALNDFGSFDSRVDLPADSPPGYYYLTICLPASRFEMEDCESLHFQVAEYRLPEYQVSLTAQPAHIAAGETAAMLLEGKYYFGGAVSDAAASYQVEEMPYIFDYRGDGNYDFGQRGPYPLSFESYGFDASLGARGDLQTDAAGQARFDLTGALDDAAGSQRWLVEAAVSDESGQAIYTRSPLIVHQGLLYIGARAEDYVSRAGEDSRIQLIAVDWDSQPIADQPIDIEIVELRWISLPEQDPVSGRVSYSWEVEEIPVAAGSVISDSRGRAEFVYQPPLGGHYKIIATARDADGRLVKTTTTNWVAGDSAIPWRQENDTSIELVPARREYRVGDRAEILITSPYPGEAQALVSIERGNVLDIDLIALRSNSHIYEFDILPEHAPNIYVSVFLLKQADAQNPAASWRYGLTHLSVAPEQYELDIEIRPDRSSAAPRDTVKVDLQVKDHRGAPVVAELGLGLTDAAALALAERNSQPLLQKYYGEQMLGVQTATSLQLAHAESPAALEAAMDMRGFGGGGGFVEPGVVDLRDDFIDTPYWTPALVTDSEGRASVELRLPDNLTTWRMDARAWTKPPDGPLLVGESTHDLQSALPLLIRPQTPRFFIVGDRAQLAAVVNNNSESALTVTVTMDNLAGLTLAESTPQSQVADIPAGGRARLTWLVEVGDVKSVAPSFTVRSHDGAYGDASISPVSADSDGALPVYNYAAPETVGAAGMMSDAGRRVEALLLPSNLDLRKGSLDIRLDKSLAGVVTQSLTALDAEASRYRECADSLVSRLLANLAAYRALAQLALPDSALEDKLEARIAESLPKLTERQNDDGGWSWCGAGYSSQMTSAHALLALARARGQGYAVDAAVIRRAQTYLRAAYVAPSLAAEHWQLNRAAFLDYALAQSGAPDSQRTAELYESRQRLNLDALALLAQTLYGINPDDGARLDALAQQLLNAAASRATGTFFEERQPDAWNWSSDIRSTALALDALLTIQPDSQLLPNVVRYLVSARQGGHWGSLQASTWAITALTNWMLHSGELEPSYAYSAAINGDALLEDAAIPDSALQADTLEVDIGQLIHGETNLLEIKRGAGGGALYYTAHLNALLPVPALQPLSRGIDIARAYTVPGDETRSPIASAAIGDTVQVRLRIIAPNTLRNVVIEDYFPAGAEAIDPALDTSQQIGASPGGEGIDPQAQGWGWWHFDHIEFRDEKATIYASYLPRGVYEYVYSIRPTVAGDYLVIPPTAQEMHFPEVYARGAGTVFRIAE